MVRGSDIAEDQQGADVPPSRAGRAAGVMAAGTAVSRLTGLLRTGCIVWALGTALNADIFENANSIPNALYVLVGGGVVNVVLVPQLVKNIAASNDDGAAFTSRVFTLAFSVLALGTVVALALVPLLVRLLFGSTILQPGYADQRRAAELLMYLTVPQVFLYGAFVLVGQALNARERFGPMMWAPVVNNLVAIAVFVGFAAVFGRAGGSAGFSDHEVLLLGAGSTLGVALQLAVLLPSARAAGLRYRPRFDLRGTGLAPTLRAGGWTLAFVAVNQVVYLLTLRLATQGNLDAAGDGSGSFLFGLGFLVSQLPHGVITVSVVTAVLPALVSRSLAGDRAGFRSLHLAALRTCLVLVVPPAVLCLVLAQPVGRTLAIGAAGSSAPQLTSVVAATSLVVLTFCVHFVMLRGFYAVEDTRTPFLVQCVVSVVLVATAVPVTQAVPPRLVAAALLLSYGVGYAVGAAMGAVLLGRQVGGLGDGRWGSFLVRLVPAAGALAAVSLGTRLLVPSTPVLVQLGLAGGAGLTAYALAVRLLRLPVRLSAT